jgi:hypothetical protein
MLVLDERHQVDVVLALDDEDALAGVPIGVRVFQDVQETATLNVEDDVLERTAPSSPELQALEAELARKHWEAWLDTKVPALGDRTPRQAAKSASGRERLEALLASYGQNRVGGRNAFDPDIAALKLKLGLA